MEILNSKIWSVCDLMVEFPLGLFLSFIPYLFHSRKSGSGSDFTLLPENKDMVLFPQQAKKKTPILKFASSMFQVEITLPSYSGFAHIKIPANIFMCRRFITI